MTRTYAATVTVEVDVAARPDCPLADVRDAAEAAVRLDLLTEEGENVVSHADAAGAGGEDSSATIVAASIDWSTLAAVG